MGKKYDFVDCQGLAGAWTLGTVGPKGIGTDRFRLVARKSLPGGFGDEVVEANRHLLRGNWESEIGDSDSWEPVVGVAFLSGTPPCSGFSLLNSSKKANARGPDAAINSCMKELARYAGGCTGADGLPGPEVVSFESVQGAYKEGRELMLILRDIISTRTRIPYTLSHVLMSGSSVGAAQMRHRYYPVFHRIPFGCDAPEPQRVVTYEDAIGDLQGLDLKWEDQYLRRKPATWATRLRRSDSRADAHVVVENAKLDKFLGDLMPFWEAGEDVTEPARRYRGHHGVLPEAFTAKPKNWDYQHDRPGGWHHPTRIRPDKPGYVITGAGSTQFVHWSEDRLLTVRELSRLMGYPDSWSWSMARHPGHAGMWIGKCCPVDSGRWISGWVAKALDESPGAAGEQVNCNNRELLHNFTLDYKRWPTAVSGYTARR